MVEIEDTLYRHLIPFEATMSTVSFNQVEVTDNINGQNSTGMLNQSGLSMIDSTITGQQGGTHRCALLSDPDLDVYQLVLVKRIHIQLSVAQIVNRWHFWVPQLSHPWDVILEVWSPLEMM